jgi:hypothetical protein
MFQKNIEELMQISRYRLKDYIKGQRAMPLSVEGLHQRTKSDIACPIYLLARLSPSQEMLPLLIVRIAA